MKANHVEANERLENESQSTRPSFTLGTLRITSDAGHPSNLRITSTRRRHVAKVYADK